MTTCSPWVKLMPCLGCSGPATNRLRRQVTDWLLGDLGQAGSRAHRGERVGQPLERAHDHRAVVRDLAPVALAPDEAAGTREHSSRSGSSVGIFGM